MSYVLISFNSVEDFPRFSSYVDYLEDYLHYWLSERPISSEIESAVRDIIENNDDNSFFTLRYEDWCCHPIYRQIQANVNDIVQKYISDPNYLGPHPTRWWSQHELESEQLNSIVCRVATSIDFELNHKPSSPRDRIYIPHALDKMLALAKKALYEHNINPYSISNLLKKQLEMTKGILGWVEDAKKTEKYQHEAGLPPKVAPERTISAVPIDEPEKKGKPKIGRPLKYKDDLLRNIKAAYDEFYATLHSDKEARVKTGEKFEISADSVRMALSKLRNKKLRN